MNVEVSRNWCPAARSERDAIGAVLRRIFGWPSGPLPQEWRQLIERLEVRTKALAPTP
jgi:hypothetical protein